jgi:hypothetical protein
MAGRPSARTPKSCTCWQARSSIAAEDVLTHYRRMMIQISQLAGAPALLSGIAMKMLQIQIFIESK